LGRKNSIGNAEYPRELEVRPVIERVPDAIRNRARPCVELLSVGSIAGHEALVDSVRAHRAPLVVVACKPRVREIAESRIFVNERRIEMTMEVEYRHFGSMIVEKPLRRLVSKQEIIRNELHFFNYSPFVCGNIKTVFSACRVAYAIPGRSDPCRPWQEQAPRLHGRAARGACDQPLKTFYFVSGAQVIV
jgi:hypothetical protein